MPEPAEGDQRPALPSNLPSQPKPALLRFYPHRSGLDTCPGCVPTRPDTRQRMEASLLLYDIPAKPQVRDGLIGPYYAFVLCQLYNHQKPALQAFYRTFSNHIGVTLTPILHSLCEQGKVRYGLSYYGVGGSRLSFTRSKVWTNRTQF